MGKVDFDKISARATELLGMIKNRNGKFSDEERLELLNEMFDCSLIRAVKSAVSGDSKFSSTAIALMNSALDGIAAIEAKSETGHDGIDIGFDPLVKTTGGGSDVPKAEA